MTISKHEPQNDASATGRYILNKVPEITIYFWIIKVLCTTVGETAADFLNSNLHLGLTGTTFVMGSLLLITLIFQFASKRYVPSMYWLAVVLISIVGTLITDNLTDNFGVSLETTTIVFSIALAAIFAMWYACERTLSVHTIYTLRREVFYWLAILFTFALGTAAGDLAAEKLNLGYAVSASIFGALIAVVTVAHLRFKLNPILAFWIAYILTRPLGASLGDYLSQPSNNGGLALDTVLTSALFLTTILLTVAYLTITKKDTIAPADLPMAGTESQKREQKTFSDALVPIGQNMLNGAMYIQQSTDNVRQVLQNLTGPVQQMATDQRQLLNSMGQLLQEQSDTNQSVKQLVNDQKTWGQSLERAINELIRSTQNLNQLTAAINLWTSQLASLISQLNVEHQAQATVTQQTAEVAAKLQAVPDQVQEAANHLRSMSKDFYDIMNTQRAFPDAVKASLGDVIRDYNNAAASVAQSGNNLNYAARVLFDAANRLNGAGNRQVHP